MIADNGWWNPYGAMVFLLCLAVLSWIGVRRGRRRVAEQTDIVLKKQEEGQALLRRLVGLQEEANSLLRTLVERQMKE